MDFLRPFRVTRKPFSGLLHIALTTIVVGACVTHFFGEQGQIHLRLAQTTSLQTNHSKLSIFLWDFQIVNDKEGNPADFVTELRIIENGKMRDENGELLIGEGVVRMNKPLKYHGYRFCQADYDSDGQGVVLSYNYDPWGIGITYIGYALLLLAMIGFFFQKNTFFRATLHRLTSQWSRTAAMAIFVSLGVFILTMAVVMTHVVMPKPPLQPVLQTPLLGIHVSVIMLSYTLFAVIMINGILGLCMTRKSETLMTLSQILLYPALFCLTAGIFIGAVWANLSWGRYWGWDPKETWALITMIVYAALLHWPIISNRIAKRSYSETSLQKNAPTGVARSTAKRSLIAYHVMSILAFLFVLFTYFGVNRLLGGLHSYAN